MREALVYVVRLERSGKELLVTPFEGHARDEQEHWTNLLAMHAPRCEPIPEVQIVQERRTVYVVATPRANGDQPAVYLIYARSDDEARAIFAADKARYPHGPLRAGKRWWGNAARLYRSGESNPIDVPPS